MQDRQSVSVIIINHNAGNILIQCVTNAMDQARQTIVIDNASSDNSLNNLKAAFPGNKNLIIHCADTNQGFAAGCNMGYKLAHEAYILFLNPDCILEKNTISTLIQALESNASIGMTGGQITNPDGTEQGGARRDIPTPGGLLYALQVYIVWKNSGRKHFLTFICTKNHYLTNPLKWRPLQAP